MNCFAEYYRVRMERPEPCAASESCTCGKCNETARRSGEVDACRGCKSEEMGKEFKFCRHECINCRDDEGDAMKKLIACTGYNTSAGDFPIPVADPHWQYDRLRTSGCVPFTSDTRNL